MPKKTEHFKAHSHPQSHDPSDLQRQGSIVAMWTRMFKALTTNCHESIVNQCCQFPVRTVAFLNVAE